MPIQTINESVVSGVKKFLDALNSSGGTPIEQLSPPNARQVLTDAQNSVRVDLSGIDKSEKTIDVDGKELMLQGRGSSPRLHAVTGSPVPDRDPPGLCRPPNGSVSTAAKSGWTVANWLLSATASAGIWQLLSA